MRATESEVLKYLRRFRASHDKWAYAELIKKIENELRSFGVQISDFGTEETKLVYMYCSFPFVGFRLKWLAKKVLRHEAYMARHPEHSKLRQSVSSAIEVFGYLLPHEMRKTVYLNSTDEIRQDLAQIDESRDSHKIKYLKYIGVLVRLFFIWLDHFCLHYVHSISKIVHVFSRMG